MDSIYLEFEKLCKNGSYNEIEYYIINNDIDINYEENFYINLIVKRGNINLLKLIKKYNGNLHDEDETIIHLLGLYGFTDCLEYVINDCSNDNWKTIINTNAYNNCINTKKIINNLLCV